MEKDSSGEKSAGKSDDFSGSALRAVLREDYIALIQKIIDAGADFKGCGFASLVGSEYGRHPVRLLVIGRAVDGWREVAAGKSSSAEQIVDDRIFLGHEEDRNCEMNWISRSRIKWQKKTFRALSDNRRVRHGYNYKNSSFWSSIRDMVHFLRQGDVNEGWPASIAWSNVYKISPLKGNPGNKLRGLQLSECTEILKKEIEYLCPTHILFITGDWGKKIINALGISPQPTEADFAKTSMVRHVGKLGKARVIIASRPEGRNREAWVASVVENWRY